MGMEDITKNVSPPVEREEEGSKKNVETVVVTEVCIKTVNQGWVVEVEYDYNDLDQFAFTDIGLMLGFVRDMTETPIRTL